jgi:hypothetical protein
MRNELSAISARHERALIRGAKLREALEPFARHSDRLHSGYDNGDPMVSVFVADIRHARAVLAETKGDGDE